jgi:hypothetical protein
MKLFVRAVIVTLFLSIFPITGYLFLSSPQPAVQIAQATTVGVHQICPVADCSAYPVPSEIQGTTIATLQNWLLYVKTAEMQIRTAPAWNVNTVRLQVEQDRLVNQQGRVDHVYFRALRTIVRYALYRHLIVILNAQTELAVGYWRNEPMPTLTTYRFWRLLTEFYGNKPHVVFDLFNEPRSPHPWTGDWTEWKTDFQALVGFVRRIGSLNQIWVEGENWGSTLQNVPLLAGQGIVYSFHHPGCPHPGDCGGPKGKEGLTTGIWEKDFGYLASNVPVVDGEFVNYLGGYYWPHSTSNVTRYFEFLHYHRIGLVSWTLQAGIMTMADPRIPMAEPVSAGRLFMRYFHGRLSWAR